MKVKVCLYSEKAEGSPITGLTDPVYVDVTVDKSGMLVGLTEGVLSVLRDGDMYLKNPEIVTQIEVSGINRLLDLVNVQVSLREDGLLLLVGEVASSPVDPKDVSAAELQVTVVGNVSGTLPMITDYYTKFDELSIKGIIQDQSAKYRIGDTTLIPESQIASMISSMEEMERNGVPINSVYESALLDQFARYGFTMYYIYTS